MEDTRKSHQRLNTELEAAAEGNKMEGNVETDGDLSNSKENAALGH